MQALLVFTLLQASSEKVIKIYLHIDMFSGYTEIISAVYMVYRYRSGTPYLPVYFMFMMINTGGLAHKDAPFLVSTGRPTPTYTRYRTIRSID